METPVTYRKSGILVGTQSTSTFQRFIAKAIDVLILAVVYFLGKALWWPLGAMAATLLASTQDALGEGQSIGKRIIGLRVIEEPSGMACSIQTSFLRNLPLVILFACAPFELLWGIALFLVVPLFLLEIYLLFQIDTGVRLGDVIGNSLVVEYVEPAPDVASS